MRTQPDTRPSTRPAGRWAAALAGLTLLLGTSGCQAAGEPQPFAGRADMDAFVGEMAERHGFDAAALGAVMGQARSQPSIVAAISRPAEAKPWHQYRPIFLTDSRVRGGVAFWDAHAETLARAEAEYGVPPEIVIAIIGVETRYGRHTGKYRVLDALATLAFDYPPRANFFRGELEHYLLLTRDEGLDPLSLKGSYAGAMGHPQFISSSYRSYAVDFDGDGRRDIWNSPADAIGSVAHYLGRHGWQRGRPVAGPARVDGRNHKGLVVRDLKPRLTADSLKEAGVEPENPLPDGALATLIELEAADGPEYWVGLDNFYAITRYNHSALYAMAVYQLSDEIRRARAAARGG